MPEASARLFLALWPPAGALPALQAHRAGWRWPAHARPIPAERLHITLHFIGPVPSPRVDELKAALAVPFQPFELVLPTAELWRGGLAVLCADAIAPPLASLHARLGARLAALGLPVEQRPLRVHITLARDAQGAQPPQEPADVRWRADAGYALVQSLPGGQGYRTLQSYGG
jgi:2'-5' RNA ligase